MTVSVLVVDDEALLRTAFTALIEAGISVYSLRQTHASLEDWFLSVTSRFGGEQ
jgi:FixJ family two-component response regulator